MQTITRVLCSSFVVVAGLSLSVGCPKPDNNNDAGVDGGVDDNDAGTDGGGNVIDPPDGGTVTIKDVQDATSANHPAAGTQITIENAVATTGVFNLSSDGSRKGLFIADAAGGPLSGVLVELPGTFATVINIGDSVTVVGTVDEVSIGAPGAETRIKGTSATNNGAGTAITPVAVDAATLTDETVGEPFEGMLVTISNVTVENADVGFGQFQVTGGLIVDDVVFHYSAITGETITSLTGVVGYNVFQGGFRLLPRSAADVVSSGATFPTKTIPQLRNPAAVGAEPVCATGASCAPVQLSKVVVTSPTFVLDRDDTTNNPFLFGFYVADPTAVDADGRLLPFSGILVAVAPGSSSMRELTYTFGKDASGNFVNPDGSANFPRVGDIVTVAGQNTEFFGNAQFARTVQLRQDGVVGDALGIPQPKPARFDGSLPANNERNPARLKGGRPDSPAAEFGPAAQPAIAPDAAVESWEGVHVELVNVVTTDACFPVPFNPSDNANSVNGSFLRDFGNFLVTGDVEIGTLFRLEQTFGGFFPNTVQNPQKTCENLSQKCEDSRALNQQFTSLQGIINFSFDVYRVNPRQDSDIAPNSLFVAPNTGNCPAQ